MKKGIIRVLIIGVLIIVASGTISYFSNHHGKLAARAKDGGDTIPARVDERLSESFTISAEVEIGESVRKNGFSKYKAVLANYDVQDVFDALDSDAMFCEPDDEPEWIQVQGQNGEYFNKWNSKGYNGFDYSDSDDLYLAAALYDESNEEFLSNYPMEESFGHFTMEQCDKRIEEILNCFSPDGEYKILHRTMNHEVMKDNAYLLHRDDDGMDPLVRAWAESDDTYRCAVFQVIDGVRVIEMPTWGVNSDVLEQAPIQFSVTENRIVQCIVPQIYMFKSQEGNYELLDFDSLMENVKKIVENRPSYGEHIIVEQIEFAVAPISCGDETYEIRPVWVFDGHGTEAVEGEEMRWKYEMIIDAVTGDVLAQ